MLPIELRDPDPARALAIHLLDIYAAGRRSRNCVKKI
jgi:hypothetical protein